MRSRLLLGIFLTLPAAAQVVDRCDVYCRELRREPLIVAETKDCEGNYGLASFAAERVFKISVGNCRDPDDTDRPLYQLLLKTLTGAGDYEVLWIDAQAMHSIREQLEENRQAALRRQ